MLWMNGRSVKHLSEGITNESICGNKIYRKSTRRHLRVCQKCKKSIARLAHEAGLTTIEFRVSDTIFTDKEPS